MSHAVRRRFAEAVLAVAAPLLLAACSDSDSTAPINAEPCTGDVALSVTPGTTPIFTWTPACKVLALLVEEGASDRWFVGATGDGIAPAVRYGVVPPGASESDPALPLVQGTTYEVIVYRGTEAQPVIADLREFTP